MVPEPVNDFFAIARTALSRARAARTIGFCPRPLTTMDLGILVALAMLVVWAVWAFAFSAPGFAHILLTAGVFLLIYRIVVRGTPGYHSGDR